MTSYIEEIGHGDAECQRLILETKLSNIMELFLRICALSSAAKSYRKLLVYTNR
jgi:hypothetical protein